MIKANVTSAIRNTVPISQFNRGKAGKILEDVKATGAKVVMKNNVAECVLLAPDEYTKLMDELENAKLLAIANERLAKNTETQTLSEEDVMNELGITEEEIESADEVEFE